VTSVVIDPSVYVSALIGQPGSAPDLVIRAAIDDKLAVIVCPLLIRELESVLARPKFRRYVTSAQAKEYVAHSSPRDPRRRSAGGQRTDSRPC
jgi:putative PIN family toxin of toxin-antitoxin system